MPSIRQSIRSSTASKRPTSAIADGQIALNTASGTPGMFFKDSAGNIIKTGPAHYGASAPNSSPAVGGSTGNSIGEAWLDSSLTPAGWKIWNGSAWVNATPLSSDSVQGLVELATDAETQAGVDTARAVTAASLQSKVSDSISTASASGIASSAAVKTAYDLANAALPKSGGIITGNLEIGSTGSLTFEGSTADGFETTLAVVDPTLDRTITFPNITGTVVTTGDTGTVTSTMILDGTILNADVNTAAAIAFSKLASLTSARILLGNSSNVATATAVTGDVTISNTGVTAIASNVIVNADVNSAAAIAYSKLALSSGIVNTDISASAAIAGTKISPTFGSQTIVAASGVFNLGSVGAPSITISGDPNTGIYSPGADQLAVSTSGTTRLFVNGAGQVGIGTTSPTRQLDVNSTAIFDIAGTGTGANPSIAIGSTSVGLSYVGGGHLSFTTGSAEKARIDSSGRLLVGTSTTSGSAAAIQIVQGFAGINNAGCLLLSRTNNTPASDDALGEVVFGDSGHTRAAEIRSVRDGGTWTSGSSQPTRLVFSTTADGAASPTERMRIDSSGRVGIGTASPSYALHLSSAGTTDIFIGTGGDDSRLYFTDTSRSIRGVPGGNLTFQTSATERLRIDPSGNVGIGTTSPNALLDVRSATAWVGDGTTDAFLQFNQSATAANRWHIGAGADNALLFYKGTYGTGSEKARIDSSGRLLVGTSTSLSNAVEGGVQIVGTAADAYLTLTRFGGATASAPAGIVLGRSRSGTKGTNTAVSDGDFLGVVEFTGADGGTSYRSAAQIAAYVDGAVSGGGAADMPGRLVFSTTADGEASPTTRVIITNQGITRFNRNADDSALIVGGRSFGNIYGGSSTKAADFASVNDVVFGFERVGSDGTLINFSQDGTVEGTISVSGTAVSYNGAHLSRWSQLPSGAERTEILRGSVLSNIDEMCEWGDEDNEQLNRMKVSDVEGDKNVSGVFQGWDDDDDTYVNDFYCAMTGDFIIRIAEGVTVERGDLLMSAGDGTAKPQDDDIIRSKTIAKVTSTNVSCTYEDGSYCVPCVLMAC